VDVAGVQVVDLQAVGDLFDAQDHLLNVYLFCAR
jgi:hypothetical protein